VCNSRRRDGIVLPVFQRADLQLKVLLISRATCRAGEFRGLRESGSRGDANQRSMNKRDGVQFIASGVRVLRWTYEVKRRRKRRLGLYGAARRCC